MLGSMSPIGSITDRSASHVFRGVTVIDVLAEAASHIL